MPIECFDIEFIACENIASQVKQFQFKLIDKTPFSYSPGQFITLHLPWQDEILKRSYSLSMPPLPNTGLIEFAMSYILDGRASDLLFHLTPGVTLKCSGPFGRLILPDDSTTDPTRYILVATGTGVTPYRAMKNQIAKRLEENPSLKCHLLFGTRTQTDMLYEKEFLELAQNFENFSYTVSLSREKNNFLDHQKAGYVQDHFESLNLDPDSDIIYLCGNPEMIDDAFNKLKTLGFNNRSVRREKYISK